LNEEINIETAEMTADTPETDRRGIPSGAPEMSVAPDKTGGFKNPPLQDHVIARSEATKQSQGIEPEKQQGEKLAQLETALGEAKQSLNTRTGDCDRLKAALDDAVGAYRKLAVSTSPLYSDDMISGSSVEEIDASIKKVNGLVKKMRSTLEAELKDLTVPAGAPERSAPDLSGLSPRDKIKQGILSDKNK